MAFGDKNRRTPDAPSRVRPLGGDGMVPWRTHNELLTDWSSRPAHVDQVFVSDGIISQEKWHSAPRRTAFLLKEAYGGEASWDICAKVRDEWGTSLGRTLRRAAYLAYATQHCTGTSLPEIPSGLEAFEQARSALLGSALVNIKKSDGMSTSNPQDIDSALERDGELVKEQLEIIDPQIIICGGTWYCAKRLWPEATYVYDMVWKHGKRYFIDFWHPGDRTPEQAAYYSLAALLRYSGIAHEIPA